MIISTENAYQEDSQRKSVEVIAENLRAAVHFAQLFFYEFMKYISSFLTPMSKFLNIFHKFDPPVQNGSVKNYLFFYR